MKEQVTNEFVEMCQRIVFEVSEGQRRQAGEEWPKAAAIAEMLEAMTDGVCVIGHDGKVINVNPAFERLTGYTRDELMGEAPLKMHPERERERILAGFRECTEKKGFVRGFETVFLRKDKKEIPIHLEFHTYRGRAEERRSWPA